MWGGEHSWPNFVSNARGHTLSEETTHLTQLYIFISVSFELASYSWIAGLDYNIQWNELFLLRVYKYFGISLIVQVFSHRHFLVSE